MNSISCFIWSGSFSKGEMTLSLGGRGRQTALGKKRRRKELQKKSYEMESIMFTGTCSFHRRTPARPRCPLPAVRIGTSCTLCHPGPCKQCPHLHHRRHHCHHPYSLSDVHWGRPAGTPEIGRQRSRLCRCKKKQSCSRLRIPHRSPAFHSRGEGCLSARFSSGNVW